MQYHLGGLTLKLSSSGLWTHSFFSGAGYTFGAGVVHKFLQENDMSHILRAHQLCMEGYSSLFDKHLSTVWSAPNYCYRCGNSASILEVGPGRSMFFNVFEAAPENDRDGPAHQQAQNAQGRVSSYNFVTFDEGRTDPATASRVLPVISTVAAVSHTRRNYTHYFMIGQAMVFV